MLCYTVVCSPGSALESNLKLTCILCGSIWQFCKQQNLKCVLSMQIGLSVRGPWAVSVKIVRLNNCLIPAGHKKCYPHLLPKEENMFPTQHSSPECCVSLIFRPHSGVGEILYRLLLWKAVSVWSCLRIRR